MKNFWAVLAILCIAFNPSRVLAFTGTAESLRETGFETSGVKLIARETLFEGFEVLTFEDSTGKIARMAWKQFPKITYFWYIQNDAELSALCQAAPFFTEGMHASLNLWGSLPLGGWFTWDGNVLLFYISSGLAQCWAAGGAVALIVIGIAASLSPGAPLGWAIMTALPTLTTTVITMLDATGNPGFYIRASLNPLGVRFLP